MSAPTRTFALWTLIGCFALVATSGCSSGERRYQLSGKVTYKGKPVPEGYIVLEPDSSKGGSGGPGRAKIIDGAFDTATADGMGTLGGPHIIRVTGFDRKIGGGTTGAEVTLPKSLFTDHTVKMDLPQKNASMDFDIK